MNVSSVVSPQHVSEFDKTADNSRNENSDSRNENGSKPKSPKGVVHNISINVTDADSPEGAGVRRRLHLRSLSDVTAGGRAFAASASPRAPARARALSDRPRRASPPAALAAAHLSPHREISTLTSILAECETTARRAHSERSSPDASVASVADAAAQMARPRSANRFRSDTVIISGDPWRKMSELDLEGGRRWKRTPTHAPLERADSDDPWVKSCTLRPPAPPALPPAACDDDDCAFEKPNTADADSERDLLSLKRGKLERRSPIACDSCGNESCECWRARSPCRGRAPRTPRTPRLSELRQARALSSPAAACTCEAPRPGPVSPPPSAADPLLETTC